jgi:type I restriction enzyme, R subunit
VSGPQAALTELFEQAPDPDTPVIVGRVAADIDEIVRLVRFSGSSEELTLCQPAARSVQSVS